MRAILLPILACALVSLVRCQTAIQPLCSQQPTSAMHLSVSSLRNQNGSWVTKVDLERGGGRGKMEAMRTEPWSVDVDANTRTCEGAESTLHVSFTLTAPLLKVGPDYELFPGVGWYKFHAVPKTWAIARQVCAEEGAHLVIVNSEKEDEVIKGLIARNPTIAGASSNDWIWVGVERKAGDYVTIFGDKLSTTGFERWHPSEPHKHANDNCILVNRASGGLGDVICDWVLGFTCEKEL